MGRSSIEARGTDVPKTTTGDRFTERVTWRLRWVAADVRLLAPRYGLGPGWPVPTGYGSGERPGTRASRRAAGHSPNGCTADDYRRSPIRSINERYRAMSVFCR